MIKTGSWRSIAIAVLIALVALSGCVYSGSDATLSFKSNTPQNNDSEASAECGDSAELTVETRGVRSGTVRVRVHDGDGFTVFDETYVAGEGGVDARGLFGTPGTWMLEMQAFAVEGQMMAQLSC